MTEQLPDPELIDVTDDQEFFTAGDEDIVLDETVFVVQDQIDAIHAIEDEAERLAAVKEWVRQLNGE